MKSLFICLAVLCLFGGCKQRVAIPYFSKTDIALCDSQKINWAIQLFGNFSKDTLIFNFYDLDENILFEGVESAHINNVYVPNIIIASIKTDTANVLYIQSSNKKRSIPIKKNDSFLTLNFSLKFKDKQYIVQDTLNSEKYYSVAFNGWDVGTDWQIIHWKAMTCKSWTYE